MKNIYDFARKDKEKSREECKSIKKHTIGLVAKVWLIIAMLFFGSAIVTQVPLSALSQQEVYAQEELPVELEICNDGIDNNNNGQTDEEPCELVSDTNEICNDGIDNNNNGQTDEEPCELVSDTNEICNDGIDNNNNGQTDEEPCELVSDTNDTVSS
jgi:hypothetical protein